MIIPPKKEDPKKRYYAASVTAALTLSFYLILIIASVADPDTTRIYITELTQLNISNFQPRVPEPEMQPTPDDPAPQQESPAEVEVQVEISTPQRINLNEILPQGVQVDLSASRTPRESISTQASAQNEPRALRMEQAEMERIGGLQTLSGSSLSAPSANRRSLGGNGGLEGSIGLAEGAELSGGRRGVIEGGGTGSLLSGPQVRDGNTQGREIGLRDLSEFGEGYSDMDPIIHDLIRWMRENPADLPVPITRRMGDGRWDPNYLTSRVPFYILERQFDLLLMAKEEDLELHIFLVENKMNATYLIDRGFIGESSSLRVGNVGYQQDDIAHVDSAMRPAGNQENRDFYQIFLSWWESVEFE